MSEDVFGFTVLLVIGIGLVLAASAPAGLLAHYAWNLARFGWGIA